MDAGTGRAVRRMSRAESDEIHALAFSPDGCTLAVAVAYYSPMPVSLWDPATGREKGRLGEDLLSVFHLAFSPDGRFLAASGQHDAIRIWEVASGKEAYRLHAGEDGVSKIVYAPDGRRLISLGDLTLLVWDATGLADKRRRGALSPEELRSFWDTQAGEDARRAYSAIWCLAALPEQAVAYLGDRLRPVPAIPPKQVERWIADLDDDEFAVREKATAELGKLGEAAVLPLRDGLAKKPSAEAQQRLERLVAAAEVAFASGDRLRELRAAAVLEYVGTPEARRVLVTLAKGAPAARLTREAKASLERLEKKPAGGQP